MAFVAQDVESYLHLNGCVYLILNHEGADILKKIYGNKVDPAVSICGSSHGRRTSAEPGLAEEVIGRHMNNFDLEMELP